jgi:hypothetical protein
VRAFRRLAESRSQRSPYSETLDIPMFGQGHALALLAPFLDAQLIFEFSSFLVARK